MMSKRRSETIHLLTTVPRPRPAIVRDHAPDLIRRHLDNLQILMLTNDDLARAIFQATESWARGQHLLVAHGHKLAFLVGSVFAATMTG